jgi:hypothetical protein
MPAHYMAAYGGSGAGPAPLALHPSLLPVFS